MSCGKPISVGYKYDDGDEEWSSLPFLKVHPWAVYARTGGWWRRLLSREFILPQLELISYLGLFLLFLFGLSRTGSSPVTGIPRELFSFGVLMGLFGNYAWGLIPVVVIFALFFALTFRASMKKNRFFIIKTFTINLVLTFIVNNFIVLAGLIDPAQLNGVMFFSMFVSLLFPIAVAVYYDVKRGRGFLREFLVFAAMVLLATLPQIIRMRFTPDSIIYFFMELAVVYITAFFVFIPFEWSKGARGWWDRLIKLSFLYSGIVLLPLMYIIAYAVIGMAGEAMFGRGSVPNTLFSGGAGGIFGPLEVAPMTMVYLFIMEYLHAASWPDLVEGILLFWSISSLAMNLSGKANLFHDMDIGFSGKKMEIVIGTLLLLLYFSQPLWR